MRFGSVCSGIEAASVAWPFWEAAWFSEIEPFPCAVLKHHYPDVPNYGDMTTLPERILSGEVEAPDVFCGGTPCQAFSVAGNRKSLDDARGNLSLTFCEIADAIDTIRQQRNQSPAIIFWENVPGVLNTKDNAFGCFLGELTGETVPLQPSGGRWTDAGFVSGPKRTIAWRVLDAQYFGVAQRRRRVFVVASSRKGFNPSEILLEFSGERRDTAPCRQARQGIAADAESGIKWPADVASTLNAAFGSKQGLEDQHINGGAPLFVPHPFLDQQIVGTLTAGFGKVGAPEVDAYTCLPWPSPDPTIAPHHAFKIRGGCEGNGKGYLGQDEQDFTITTGHDQQVAVAIQDVREVNKSQNGKGWRDDGVAYTVDTFATQGVATQLVGVPIDYNQQVAVGIDLYNCTITGDLAATLSTRNGIPDATGPRVMTSYAVRRLTPVECERLQGFPDNYTNIPWRKKPESPDGPRYKALGNSWAVPVVRWIGERINNAVNRL